MINMPVEPAITEHMYRKATHRRIPLGGTFEITPLCNMNCRMCYVRLSKQEQESLHALIPGSKWIELGREAVSRGMLYLLVTGGEPFSHPDVKEILAGLHSLGLVISFNTNGTLIDENVVSWLKRTPPARLNITLYGASDETYAGLCRSSDGFTRVTRAIELLREAGITVKLNCSLTPYNISDLEAMVRYAESKNLILETTAYMFPPMRKNMELIGTNDRFTAEEAAYVTAYAEWCQNGDEIYLARMKKRDFSIPSDIDDTCAEQGEGIRCRAGKSSFWVTWDGRMLPCGMVVSDDAPDVFEVGFDASWEAVKKYAESILLPAKCRNCAAKDSCRACAAMAKTETGDYGKVPKYRCDMMAAYPGALKQVESEILTGTIAKLSAKRNCESNSNNLHEP